MNQYNDQFKDHSDQKTTVDFMDKNCKNISFRCQICKDGCHKDHNQKINLFCQSTQLQFSKPIEMEGHQSEVKQVTISQDGSLIASGSEDKTVKLWDGKTKILLQTIENDSGVYCVAISSKNEYLVFRDYKSFIKLFDLKQNKFLWTNNDIMSYMKFLMFSQDTQYLLSGGNDKKLHIWNVININKTIHYFKTDSQIQSIAMSGDNKLVSCISRSSTIYIWDLKTKTKLFQHENTHSKCFDGYGLCTSTDSSIYISSGDDGLVKIWRPNKSQNIQKLIRSIQAQSSIIQNVQLTSDGLYIISICNYEGIIMIHEMETGKQIQVLESGTKSMYYAYISISNDMNTLVSSNGEDKTFRVWTRE